MPDKKTFSSKTSRKTHNRTARSTDDVGKRIVLIVVAGSTPAVLTEAVYALAQEDPPVIADNVVVITTTRGEQVLREKLLVSRPDWNGESVWQALRKKVIGKTADSQERLNLAPITLISRPDPKNGTSLPLDDIRSPDDNQAAAEIIFETVHKFASDADAKLIGLLSGGRKTMSALLHAAFSLAGRTGDRLLHVLVSEPFDNPRLSPVFYFPDQPGSGKHQLPEPHAEPIPTASARIDLADVPLVALGEIVSARTGNSPATFVNFVRSAQKIISGERLKNTPLKIIFSLVESTLAINHYPPVPIPQGRPFTLCRQFVMDAQKGLGLADLTDLVERWKNKVRYHAQGTDTTKDPTAEFTREDISNALNVVRGKLGNNIPKEIMDRVFPLRGKNIGFNRPNVTVELQP